MKDNILFHLPAIMYLWASESKEGQKKDRKLGEDKNEHDIYTTGGLYSCKEMEFTMQWWKEREDVVSFSLKLMQSYQCNTIFSIFISGVFHLEKVQ